jgi:hypothetical protein
MWEQDRFLKVFFPELFLFRKCFGKPNCYGGLIEAILQLFIVRNLQKLNDLCLRNKNFVYAFEKVLNEHLGFALNI